MLIKISKIGKSEFSNWCLFSAEINEFFVVSGLANYDDSLDLEENTTYKDLHLSYYQNKKGKVIFTIFK